MTAKVDNIIIDKIECMLTMSRESGNDAAMDSFFKTRSMFKSLSICKYGDKVVASSKSGFDEDDTSDMTCRFCGSGDFVSN